MDNNKPGFISVVTDLIVNPISMSFAYALSAIPVYFLLNLKPAELNYQNIQNFIEWFGVPYGLLLALVLVNVWTQFDATDRAFDQEADDVLKVYDTFLLVLDESVKRRACRLLYVYAWHVKHHYYNEYEARRKKTIGDLILSRIRTSITVLIRSRADKELAIELLRLINELIDARGDRLAHSKQRVPVPVKVLSLLTSIIWLIPFFLLAFGSLGLGALFVGGVTLVVVAILLIILDLDDPIGGTWDVNVDAWDDLLATINKRLYSAD